MKNKTPKQEQYEVTIAINVPSYAVVNVTADSQAHAEQLVEQSIERDEWNSKFYREVTEWSDDWSGADDLRVVPTA